MNRLEIVDKFSHCTANEVLDTLDSLNIASAIMSKADLASSVLYKEDLRKVGKALSVAQASVGMLRHALKGKIK